MEQVRLIIDGRPVDAKAGQTILQAALAAGIYIPHLCDHPALPHAGECKLCTVEADGRKLLACSTEVAEGMQVTIKNADLSHLRQLSMELMLASHPSECTACPKYLKCELQALTQYLGVSDARLKKLPENNDVTDQNPLMIRDLTRCVLCGRCVRVCRDVRGADVLDYHHDGEKVWIAPRKGTGLLKDGDCRFCGACIAVCPTGAIRDKDDFLANFDTEEAAAVPCRAKCPAGTDVPRYLAHIRAGNYAEALSVVREKAPFPLSLGYVCGRFCEEVCRRGEVNDAVNIRALKRFAAMHGGAFWKSRVMPVEPTGKKVAVIGSGPAGMTAAYYLTRKGHKAVIFEKLPVAGGMLRTGIPDYRLPPEIVAGEIQTILDAGVHLHLETPAPPPKELLQNGFDAVVVAVGAQKGRRLPIKGNDLPNVRTATAFLRSIALGELSKLNGTVLVLGGGNVAFDCARSAIRLGAEQAEIACLETRNEMTASEDEITEGTEEGLILHNSLSFEEIRAKDGRLEIECSRVESFSFEDGKLKVNLLDCAPVLLQADVVIFASGQMPELPEQYELPLTERALLTMDTGVTGIFSAGDVITGTASVIGAIASGRDCAAAVDQYLGGDGDLTERLSEAPERKAWLGKYKDFGSLQRMEDEVLPASLRKNFACISPPNDERHVRCEAERCLQCDLRLELPKVKFWSEYPIH